MFSAARRSVSSLLRIRSLTAFTPGKVLHRGRTEQHLKAAHVKKPKEMWNQSDINSKIDRTLNTLVGGISLLLCSCSLAFYLVIHIHRKDTTPSTLDTTPSKHHNEIKRN